MCMALRHGISSTPKGARNSQASPLPRNRRMHSQHAYLDLFSSFDNTRPPQAIFICGLYMTATCSCQIENLELNKKFDGERFGRTSTGLSFWLRVCKNNPETRCVYDQSDCGGLV